MIAITVNKNQVFEREATPEEIADYAPKEKPASKPKKPTAKKPASKAKVAKTAKKAK